MLVWPVKMMADSDDPGRGTFVVGEEMETSGRDVVVGREGETVGEGSKTVVAGRWRRARWLRARWWR